MSSSGSITFNETTQTIVNNALSLLGVLSAGGTAATNDYTFCLSILNQMLKAWEGMGIHLWTESEAVIPLVVNQSVYYLNSGNSTLAGDSAIQTNLASIASANATTVVVNTVSGMNVNDNIVIQLDNATLFSTTITAINPSTKILTLNTAITSQASANNTVTTYTNQLARPLRISNCRYCYGSGLLERRMKQAGRTEWAQLPNKNMQAPCTLYYYSPQVTQGILYIWPVPYTCADTLHISYVRTIQDMVNSTDNPDFPQEWLHPIVYNLAYNIGPAYGIDFKQALTDVPALATQYLQSIGAWDTEEGSVRIQRNKY